jgi:hypothetical protein
MMDKFHEIARHHKCDCLVVKGEVTGKIFIRHCPRHAATDEMYEALEAAYHELKYAYGHANEGDTTAVKKIVSALDKQTRRNDGVD